MEPTSTVIVNAGADYLDNFNLAKAYIYSHVSSLAHNLKVLSYDAVAMYC